MKRITIRQLRRAGACKGARRQFRRIFDGGSVKVSLRRAVKHAGEFHWDWAASNLLKGYYRRDSYYRQRETLLPAHHDALSRILRAGLGIKHQRAAERGLTLFLCEELAEVFATLYLEQ